MRHGKPSYVGVRVELGPYKFVVDSPQLDLTRPVRDSLILIPGPNRVYKQTCGEVWEVLATKDSVSTI